MAGTPFSLVAPGWPGLVGVSGGRVPLPTFPLPAGSKVVMAGDSQMARHHVTTTSTDPVCYSYTRTPLNWVWARDPRFNIDSWYDASLTSKSTAERFNGSNRAWGGSRLIPPDPAVGSSLIERTNLIAASGAKIVVVTTCSNDISSGLYTEAAPIITALDGWLNTIKKKGVWVNLITMAPRTTFNSEQAAILIDVNAWIASQTGRDGVTVIDTRAALGDGNTAEAGVMGNDGIHYGDKGARLVAALVDTVLDTQISAGNSIFITDPRDSANKFPNGAFTGTGGTKNTGFTGQLADGFVATRGSGESSTIVCSKEVVASGWEKQVFSVTPSNDGSASDQHVLIISRPALTDMAALGLSAGDWYRFGLFVEWDNWAGWYDARVCGDRRAAAGASLGTFFPLAMGNGGAPDMSGGDGIWMMSSPIQVPASQIEFRLSNTSGSATWFQIRWNKAAAGTGVAKISSAMLMKVSDPRPTWNL